MTFTLPVLIALAACAAVAILGWRDHERQRVTRRSLLDACASHLEQSKISYGGDGFPRLDGVINGVQVRAELIPDSMTIRRLPQLWLSLTRLETRKNLAEFAILVRPTGTEFYSLTSHYQRRLDAPAGFPGEILLRGSGRQAQLLLDLVAGAAARILVNEKVKEIAVTAKGLRLVWQASEGRRGEHLLLRQATFDDAHVTADDFDSLLSSLDDLGRAINAHRGKGLA